MDQISNSYSLEFHLGIDSEFFRNVFGIGFDELQEVRWRFNAIDSVFVL